MLCRHSPDWPSSLAREHLPRRAQRSVGTQHARGQPLEQQRVVTRRSPGGAARFARVRARGRRRAWPRSARGTSARARGRRPDRRPRRSRTTGARVAPGASRMRWRRLKIGSSTTPVVPDRRAAVERRGQRRGRGRARGTGPDPSPTRSGPASGLRGSGRARPRSAASPGSRRRRWHSSAELAGSVLGLEEQLPERRVRQVGGRRREREFDVAGDVDLARARALIGDREPAHLDVVLGRHGDVELAD